MGRCVLMSLLQDFSTWTLIAYICRLRNRNRKWAFIEVANWVLQLWLHCTTHTTHDKEKVILENKRVQCCTPSIQGSSCLSFESNSRKQVSTSCTSNIQLHCTITNTNTIWVSKPCWHDEDREGSSCRLCTIATFFNTKQYKCILLVNMLHCTTTLVTNFSTNFT